MAKLLKFDPNRNNPVMYRRDAKHVVRPIKNGRQVEVTIDGGDFSFHWRLGKQDVSALIKALNHAAHLGQETTIEQTFTRRWKKRA
jgi:hypothetical protein